MASPTAAGAGATRKQPPAKGAPSLPGPLLSLLQLWALGHAVTVLFALAFLVGRLVVLGGSPWQGPGFWTTLAYRVAFAGSLVTYAIILFRSHGIPGITPSLAADQAYAQRIMLDENTQYLLLVIMWLLSRPSLLLLVPFLVFSTFHTLAYTKTHVLPLLFATGGTGAPTGSGADAPPSSSTGGGKAPSGTSPLQRWTTRLTTLIATHQNRSMRAVAFYEVWFLPPSLLLGMLLGWSTFLQLVLFAQFLRFRCYLSPDAKLAAVRLGQAYDSAVARNASWLPEPACLLLVRAKEFVVYHGDLARQAQARSNSKQE